MIETKDIAAKIIGLLLKVVPEHLEINTNQATPTQLYFYIQRELETVCSLLVNMNCANQLVALTVLAPNAKKQMEAVGATNPVMFYNLPPIKKSIEILETVIKDWMAKQGPAAEMKESDLADAGSIVDQILQSKPFGDA